MAIITDIKFSENKTIPDLYVTINNPISYKRSEKVPDGFDEEKKPIFKTVDSLRLGYDFEVFTEPDGARLAGGRYDELPYNGGDIWTEAYAHLKSIHKNCKDA